MSFSSMKVDELRKVAEGFGVENTGSKAEIVARLAEEGVSFEDYQTFAEAENSTAEEVAVTPALPEPPRKPKGDEILVKMERMNHRYEIQGKTFTKEHPYVIMSEDEAQAIFDRVEGFRPATPREAAEYYS